MELLKARVKVSFYKTKIDGEDEVDGEYISQMMWRPDLILLPSSFYEDDDVSTSTSH